MGYFDSVKIKPANGVAASAEDVTISLRDDIHPYADAIRKAWLGRLDNLQRPWVKGASWDTNSFVTARKLVELANSPWAGYDLVAARNDYLDHAPRDHVWDKREKCWQQALDRTGGTGLSEPPPNMPIPDVTVLLDDIAEDELSLIIRQRFPLIDWQALWDSEDDEEEWIVEPVLPARRLVALFSAPKVGKSLLMLEIAAKVAQGERILGVMPDRPRRVLYVDFENDPRGDIRTRLRAMGIKPGTLDNLCYLSYPTLAKLDTAQGAAELMAIVAEYECELVVIDTISRAVGGEENENDTWLSFYRHTGLALKQAQIACIRLDHTGKDHEKGMRGGSAKYGDVDAVWKLSRVTEDTFRLDCTDHRMRVAEETIVLTRETRPHLIHTVAPEGRLAAFRAKVEEIVSILDEAKIANDAGRNAARDALKAIGTRASNDSLEEAVRRRKLRFGTSIQEDIQ